jgi:hypothetical protein
MAHRRCVPFHRGVVRAGSVREGSVREGRLPKRDAGWWSIVTLAEGKSLRRRGRIEMLLGIYLLRGGVRRCRPEMVSLSRSSRSSFISLLPLISEGRVYDGVFNIIVVRRRGGLFAVAIAIAVRPHVIIGRWRRRFVGCFDVPRLRLVAFPLALTLVAFTFGVIERPVFAFPRLGEWPRHMAENLVQ